MKFCWLLLAAAPLFGSSTAFWEISSYQELIKGKFEGVALHRNGELSAAPKLESVFASGQTFLWGAAQSPDGSLYVGSGNRGKLYRVDPAGKSSVLWTAEQPEIFAVAVDAKGTVYAGTSPNGKIYRIENGKATEYFAPQSTYIWALALAPDGTLYAGTGDQGKVFRITGAGQGSVYYSTGQANVTSLAFDPQQRLLAGSDPNGILYRITAKDKAFVLYDSTLPEIRAVAVDPDGTVYAAGLGGSVAKKAQSAAQGTGASTVSGGAQVTTSITVTAEAAGEIKPPPAEAPKPQTPAPPAPATPAVTSAILDVSGVEKSAVYRINPDGTVDTLWSSKEENVYDVLPDHGRTLFGTDVNGRIYSLAPDRRLSLVAQTNEAEITRLLHTKAGIVAITSNRGQMFRLGETPGPGGWYESPVYDAGAISRWGTVRWVGSGGPVIRTRAGNSARPDATWSEWSASLQDAVLSPSARYIQWKAELTGSATLASVSVGYLPQNSPPVVRSITALTSLQPAAQPKTTPASSSSAATSPYTLTVTDTGDAGPASSTGTPTQTLSRAAQQQFILSWQADDPEGDKLVYTLYFRGEGERDWKLLKALVHESTYTIDGDALADGRYFFRVVASDRESNPPASAREGELVSSPVLIDNTPPIVTLGAVTATSIDFTVTDATSPLKRCEYAIDAGPWTAVAPVTGILDTRTARFHLDLTNRPAGEHLLVLRAADSGNNTGLAKVLLH